VVSYIVPSDTYDIIKDDNVQQEIFVFSYGSLFPHKYVMRIIHLPFAYRHSVLSLPYSGTSRGF
jgi:hypothetical protein